MSKRNDKAGSPLSPSKNTTNSDSNSNSHWKDELVAKIDDLLQQYENLGYAYYFYHDALMSMLTSENEPNSDILLGAMATQRWLRASSKAALKQIKQIQYGLEQKA